MSFGVSFMVRVRDEARTLRKSIESLASLPIPYEIVLVLHNCTDGSDVIAEDLARENSRIRVFRYTQKVSRAGLETLCTDAGSVHSLPFYSNWCLAKCRFKWVFKWDADFAMTDGMRAYLSEELVKQKNARIIFAAVNSTSRNTEAYLADCLTHYGKMVFWEIPFYSSNSTKLVLSEDVYVIHDSELTDLKQYWMDDPWYVFENSIEAKIVSWRVDKLRLDFGKEPVGMARASNPECDEYFKQIKVKQPFYVNLYK